MPTQRGVRSVPLPPLRVRPAGPERPFPRRGSAVRRCRQPSGGAAPSPPREESPPPDHSSSSCWKGKYEAEPSPRCAETSGDAAAAVRASSGTERRRPSRSPAGSAACGAGALRSGGGGGGPGGCPCPPARQPPAPQRRAVGCPRRRWGAGGAAGVAAAGAQERARSAANRGDVRAVRQPGAVPVPSPAAARWVRCRRGSGAPKAAGVRGGPGAALGAQRDAGGCALPWCPRALGPACPGRRMGSGQPPLALPDPRVSGTPAQHAWERRRRKRLGLLGWSSWDSLDGVVGPGTSHKVSLLISGKSWRCRTPARLAETPCGARVLPLIGKRFLAWRCYLGRLR